MSGQNYFLGIDAGTQGVRVALLDQSGGEIASAESALPLTAGSRAEQSPGQWWTACMDCLAELLRDPGAAGVSGKIRSVSVTSTSGTVIPLDRDNRPLHPALMYSDTRQAAEGLLCREAALRDNPEGYTGFNTSSGLSKMVWYVKNFPDQARKIETWVHAADYLAGKLSGNYRTTDYTNALKSGFDVARLEWPDYLSTRLPLRREWFQQVVPSGAVIGRLLPEVADALGLPEIEVTAGMTDGCASQVASGAARPGDWNTTIGTTLVIKGVTRYEIRDPEGRLYSHRHPDGYWMPGGASNTGADWVASDFRGDLQELTRLAAEIIPTGHVAYPLRQKGERFPFVSPDARGFAPEGLSEAALFAANMEGVAYLERYAYALVERLSGEKVNAVYTAGGGSKSDLWLKIRASVLGRPVIRCSNVSGAAGAAITAASRTCFSSLAGAAAAMSRVDKIVTPDDMLADRYEAGYREFVLSLRAKGFIR